MGSTVPDPKDDSHAASDDPISSLFKADAAVPAPEIDDQPSEAELSRWEATTRSSLFDDTVTDPEPASPPRLPTAAEPPMLSSRGAGAHARGIGNAPTLIAAAAPPAPAPAADAVAPAAPPAAGRPAPPLPTARGGGLQLEAESLVSPEVRDAPPPLVPVGPPAPRRRSRSKPQAKAPVEQPPAQVAESPSRPRRRRRRNGKLVALGVGVIAVLGAVLGFLLGPSSGLNGLLGAGPATSTAAPPRAPAPKPPAAAPAAPKAAAATASPTPGAETAEPVPQAPAAAPVAAAPAAKALVEAKAEPAPAEARTDPRTDPRTDKADTKTRAEAPVSNWLDGDARHMLGKARSFLDDDEGEKAVAVMRELLRREPRNHHAMEMLAKALIDQDQGAEAAKWAAGAVARRPKRARYRVLQGDALLMAGDQAAARAAWQKALQLEPGNKAIKRRLGM